MNGLAGCRRALQYAMPCHARPERQVPRIKIPPLFFAFQVSVHAALDLALLASRFVSLLTLLIARQRVEFLAATFPLAPKDQKPILSASRSLESAVARGLVSSDVSSNFTKSIDALIDEVMINSMDHVGMLYVGS
jgi:hypothetical protein